MRKKFCFILLAIFIFFSAKAQNDTVAFSVQGGFYEDVFTLELFNANPQNHIRYTINGNRPTAQSPLFERPLLLNEDLYSKSDIYTIPISPENLVYLPDSIQHCIVVRAAAFDENDSCTSSVVTNSYFISALGCDTHGLPAISICADSLDLFDFNRGILVPGANYDTFNPDLTGNYYQKGIEWERIANVEYRNCADNSGINQICGLRTHGNRARRYPQKALKIYAREEYGKKRFKHQFFEGCPCNSFKHLVIKSFSTLYPNTGIQDYICGQTALDMGLESGQSRPVVLFLNGEYWGIYFLQEKTDERFLEDHFNIDIGHCDIVGNWKGLSEHGDSINELGNNIEFAALMDWLESADLSQEQNYQHLCSLIDIDNFMDYIIFETFVANYDWPSNNMRCWKLDGGRWRWIFFDGDAAFNNYGIDSFGNPTDLNVFGNATYSGDYSWPSSKEATLLFRRCLENGKFVSSFEDKIGKWCSEVLNYETMSQYYFHIKELLNPEIGNQSFRFGNPENFDYWNWACTLTNDFILNRQSTYAFEWHNFMEVDENLAQGQLLCFPNPFSSEIHIRFEDNSTGSAEVEIHDVLGQKVFSESCELSGEGNLILINPDLPSGIYFLKVNGCMQKIIRR